MNHEGVYNHTAEKCFSGTSPQRVLPRNKHRTTQNQLIDRSIINNEIIHIRHKV